MRVVLALALACLSMLEATGESSGSAQAKYRRRRHTQQFQLKLKNVSFPADASGLPNHHQEIAKRIGDDGVRQHPNPPVTFRDGEGYGMIGPIADYLRCAGHGNCFVTAVHDRHPWEGGYAGGTVISEAIRPMVHVVAEDEIKAAAVGAADYIKDPACVCEDEECKNCDM